MKQLFLLLVLTSFLLSKDNFIYDLHSPKNIQIRLQKVEQELKILKRSVNITKKQSLTVNNQTINNQKSPSKELGDLRRNLRNLENKVASLSGTTHSNKSVNSHTTSSKKASSNFNSKNFSQEYKNLSNEIESIKKELRKSKQITSAKTQKKELRNLQRSINKINKEIKTIKVEQNYKSSQNSAVVMREDNIKKEMINPNQKETYKERKNSYVDNRRVVNNNQKNYIIKPLNSKESNSHEQMRIDLLDEKIFKLEEKIKRVTIDMKSKKSTFSYSQNIFSQIFEEINIEYLFIAVAVVFLFLLALVLAAMSRAKQALRRAELLTDGMKKLNNKFEDLRAQKEKANLKPQENTKEEPQTKKETEDKKEEEPQEEIVLTTPDSDQKAKNTEEIK